MARDLTSEGLENLVFLLGERLGAALVEGFRDAVENGGVVIPSPSGKARAVVAPGSQRCTVPGCTRAGAAKGLCRSHYQEGP